MRVSLTTALISLTVTDGSLRVLSVVFGGVLQVFECVIPEVAQPAAQLAQALRARAIQAFGAGAPLGDQAGLAQHAEVLGDRGAGDVGEVRRDLAGWTFDVAHEAQNRLAAGIGERG